MIKLERSHRFEKFIRKNTSSFSETDTGFYFEMNDKIQQKFDKYDKLISDLAEVKKLQHTRAWGDFKIGEDGEKYSTYFVLPYIIKASIYYFKVKSKKNKYDNWLGYITEIKSSSDVEWVCAGKWGYDYTIKVNGKIQEVSTHPSSNPYNWVYDPKEVIRLMKADGIKLSKHPLALFPRGWKLSEYPNEILPELSIEVSNF